MGAKAAKRKRFYYQTACVSQRCEKYCKGGLALVLLNNWTDLKVIADKYACFVKDTADGKVGSLKAYVKQIKRDLDAKALIAYRAADKSTNAFQFVQQMFGE